MAKSYDFFRKIAFFDRSGKVSLAQLQTLAEAMKKLGQLDNPIDIEKRVLPGVTPVE